MVASSEELSYVVEYLNETHADEISEFLMTHFLKEEPLNRASKMDEKSFQPFVEKLLLRTLNVPFSQVVRLKESRKIIACAMSSIWNREDTLSEEHENDEFTFENGQNNSIAAIGNILTNLHSKFFTLKPTVNTILHLEILSVAKEYQRKGLASKLMNLQEDGLKMHRYGATGIASEISSLANQCLMSKRGYEKIAETLLNTETDSEGRPLLQCDDGTDRVHLVYKQFVLES